MHILRIVILLYSSCIKLKNKILSLYYKRLIGAKSYFHLEAPVKIIGAENIQVKGSFQALSDLRIECISKYANREFTPYLEIGDGVNINTRVHIGCINEIIIGKGTLIGSNVLITDHSHGDSKQYITPPSSRDLLSKGGVKIGENVWIGENVCILPDVSIGDGCIIGAGSVVTKSFPKYSLVAGNPAKLIYSLL